MGELEEIAALEGSEMLFSGPGDFSHGIGAPAYWNNPRLVKALKQVAKMTLKNAKFVASAGGL